MCLYGFSRIFMGQQMNGILLKPKLLLIVSALALNGCAHVAKTVGDPIKRVVVGEPVKRSVVGESFYISAYGGSENEVSGLIANAAFLKQYGVHYCTHSADNYSSSLFTRYANLGMKMIDPDSQLFLKQMASLDLTLPDFKAFKFVIPDIEKALTFERVQFFQNCTVVIGYPKELLKIKRFFDKESATLLPELLDKTPSFLTVGILLDGQGLGDARVIATPMQRPANFN